jgi:hypothetical protein
MKPNWKDAPEHIRRKIELSRRDTAFATPTGPLTIVALGALNAMRTARRYGYDTLPEEIPMPAHALVAEDSMRRIGLGLELQYEALAKHESTALRDWAAAPSELELAVVRRTEREKAELEQTVETRARNLVNEAEAERADRALAAARAKARKELETQKGQQQ